MQQTLVQNSDHRWQDFQSIKTLITDKLNNLSLIFKTKNEYYILLNLIFNS